MTEEEIRLAEEKFAESLHLAQMGMHNILDNDVIEVAITSLWSTTSTSAAGKMAGQMILVICLAVFLPRHRRVDHDHVT